MTTAARHAPDRALGALNGVTVGVNQPYSPVDRVYYTLERHARSRGLACAMIEIRNDEISATAGQRKMGRSAGRHLFGSGAGAGPCVTQLCRKWSVNLMDKGGLKEGASHGNDATRHESGGRRYQRRDKSYFEDRQLVRHANVWHLWALGVGAVISGHFSGWNFGFATGGWGGMLVAGIIIAIMYVGLVF